MIKEQWRMICRFAMRYIRDIRNTWAHWLQLLLKALYHYRYTNTAVTHRESDVQCLREE